MFSKSRLHASCSIVAILACICLLGIAVPHERRVHVAELPCDLELLDSVFWEPGDTESLRELISASPLVEGKSVLDIGTGSGLVALCCCQYGAAEVTATDVNPAAIECAQRNAKRMGFQIDTRLVPVDDGKHMSAFSVFEPTRRFDLIVSNPPWEDGKPKRWSDYALYDPDFQLLTSIMQEGKCRLNPGGKILLAYGCVDAIRNVHRLAEELEYDVVVFDDRDFDGLPPVFLPGMLLGLLPRPAL